MMKKLRNYVLLLASCTVVLGTMSCGEDFSGDIDDLKEQVTKIDLRVTNLETQVNKMNSDLEKLSVLTSAVESGFYVTEARTTDDGYELTLSNGRKLLLSNGTDNSLMPTPSINVMEMDGLYYWTLNGMLMKDSDGQPIRANGRTPRVKYDTKAQQWLISTDGYTYKPVNLYAQIVINDDVLLQVINNYVKQNTNTLISNEVLTQILSTYIQQNFSSLFNTDILNKVVTNYVQNNYTNIFSTTLIKQVIDNYVTQNSSTLIDTDILTNILINFIEQNKTTIINSQALTQVFNTYLEQNKTTMFSNEMLFQVINNFISTSENILNIELLRQIVNNYIQQNQSIIVDNEMITNVLVQYIQKYYVQLFSTDILNQVVVNYVQNNYTSIFNQNLLETVINNYISTHQNTLISETIIQNCINNYIQQNQTTIINETITQNILNNYIQKNQTTIINETILTQIITNYFQKNYNVIITENILKQCINNYITKYQTTIISETIIQNIINNYIQKNIYNIFDIDILTQIINNYFQQNINIFNQYINVFQEINFVNNEYVYIKLYNGTELNFVIYDAYARLRDRVQSIVFVPETPWTDSYYEKRDNYYYYDIYATFNYTYSYKNEVAYYSPQLSRLRYLVSPSEMADVICQKVNNGQMTAQIIISSNYSGGLIAQKLSKITTGNKGDIIIDFYPPSLTLQSQSISINGVALSVKDSQKGGTDYYTTFTPVRLNYGDNHEIIHDYEHDKALLKEWYYYPNSKNYKYFFFSSDGSFQYRQYGSEGFDGTWYTSGNNLYLVVNNTTINTSYSIISGSVDAHGVSTKMLYIGSVMIGNHNIGGTYQ